ncbi:thiamine pyrophosphate-dependent dehydrogenase E1 component subunit alpha [Curvivirga sp.]|uniref:thiamine pyrophosphate-dependent dehydrogenase E1 component subunit alpha n=1 Tax=Curvivirga sp. TaxID=2856848 RepID=UPI003B5B32F8
MPAELNQDILQTFYKKLYLIRRVEEKIAEIYPSDKIKSPVHLSIGQEYISVAVCENLRESDYVSATYRGHAAYLAKGAPLKGMIAELYGKEGGIARGRAGSMHLVSAADRVIGMSAVVGTGIPVAVGHALTLKMQASDAVVVCFFGDGATEEGCFIESVNFAALHKLPILFVCENNFLAIHEPLEKRWASNELTERIETYGISTRKFEAPDMIGIYTEVQQDIERIRNGEGPAFIECHTHRWFEHVGPNMDYDAPYRSRAVAQKWHGQDCVKVIRDRIPDEIAQNIDADIDAEINDAFNFAEESNFPQSDELYDYVYAE